jgi:hypothetical protein
MGIARAARTLTALAACAVLAAACASAAAAQTPLYGVTVDRIPHHVSKLTRALAALPRRATTRLYFEVNAPASAYLPALEQIHPVSAVMGELLDSSDERSISTEAFQTRVQSYLQTDVVGRGGHLGSGQRARTRHEAEAIMSWAYPLEPGGAGGLAYYIGGYFWWYGWEDALKPHARLAAALPAAFEDEAAALEG